MSYDLALKILKSQIHLYHHFVLYEPKIRRAQYGKRYRNRENRVGEEIEEAIRRIK